MLWFGGSLGIGGGGRFFSVAFGVVGGAVVFEFVLFVSDA